MINFFEMIKALKSFEPLGYSVREPDIKVFKIRNGLQDGEPLLENMVYILGRKEAAANESYLGGVLYVLIEGERGIEEQDTKEYGDLVLPPNYILFPAQTDREKLYGYMKSRLKRAGRVDDAYFKLSRCLMERASLERILEVAENVLQNPLFLSDMSTRVLQFSNIEALKNVDDELIQCVISHGFVISEYFDKYDYATLLSLIEKNEKAFLLKSEYEQKKDRMIVKLNINKRYFGWIVVFPYFREFEDGDCEIMDILANVLSLELERNKIGFALSCRENLLMELLSGHITSLEEFKRRAEGFDWTPGQHYYAMAIGFSEDKPYPDKERTITAYKNHLGLIFPTYKSICIGNTLLLLLETDDLPSVTGVLENFLKSYHLAVGCSEHFTDILSFRDYYEQAMDILRLGLKLYPDRIIYRYQDLYLYHIISLLEKYGSLKSYCMPEVLSLIRHDKENNTCYADTIRAYLKFRNAITAADSLYIHRNTMNYRLQKIEEMTHLNLNEGDDLYKLWFSFIILDLFPDL